MHIKLQVNRMCDEMIRNAKSMERAAAANAASTSGRFMGRFQSLPAGSVSVQLRTCLEKLHLSAITVLVFV